jgi:hypothetical protein
VVLGSINPPALKGVSLVKRPLLAVALVGALALASGADCGGPGRDKTPQGASSIPPPPPAPNGNYVRPDDACPPPQDPPGEFDNVVYITGSSTLVPYLVVVSATDQRNRVIMSDHQVLACDTYNATVTYNSGEKVLVRIVVNGAGEQFCKIQDGNNIFNDAGEGGTKKSYALCQLTTSR